jgi:tRNA dimethylallyltransferase
MNIRLRAIALAGPTASGKSAAAMHIARTGLAGRAVEIISVDSAQVYRGMDIGTAKPSAAERTQVPHHLIDILDPTKSYSAALFVDDARRLIDEIESRSAVPLLTGGTMLYFKALRDGLDAMPAADPAVRATLDERALREGWPGLHAELARVDPTTAARLKPRDAQRIQRALEVWHSTGKPLSSFHGAAAAADNPRVQSDIALISLEPASRIWLHERIARRFDEMLAGGLVDEVCALRARGDLRPGLPSMRCVGYRQAWEALDQGDLASLRERGVAATRQLAKRQLTWLRSMDDRHVVPCDGADPAPQVHTLATRLIEGR